MYRLPNVKTRINTTRKAFWLKALVYFKWSTGSISSDIVPQTDGQYLLTSYNGCAEIVDTFVVKSEKL